MNPRGPKPPRSERWPDSAPCPVKFIINARRYPGWTVVKGDGGKLLRVWMGNKPIPDNDNGDAA